MTDREQARIAATEAGSANAKARGLDDWDAEALRVARETERRMLEQAERDARLGAW